MSSKADSLKSEKVNLKYKLVAPDGGWGYAVMIAMVVFVVSFFELILY